MMINRFFVLAFLAFGLVSCSKHEVKELDKLGCTDPASLNYDPSATINDGSCLVPTQKQYAFVLEYTAKWCGPCGSWGAPQMHDWYHSGDVVAVACHVDNDPMYNPVLYTSLTSCRPTGGGVPSFWVGDKGDAQIGDLTSLKARIPIAGTVCKGEIQDSNMIVMTKTEFFNDTAGDFYLSVLILEDSINGTQGEYAQVGTTDPNYTHDFVLRGSSVAGKAYGEMILTGAVQNGKKFDKTYTIPIDPSWTGVVYPVVILWRYDPGSGMYSFVNAFEGK